MNDILALTPYQDALEAEALRVYHRYAVEVVEALGMCPWAERARLDGQVTRRVLFGREPDMEAVLDAVAAVAATPAVAVSLLIFPELELGRIEFQRFLSEMRERDSDRHELGAVPLAMAAFHPDAEADMSSPARLITFIRRTPDPTIQLVRQSVLAEVRPVAHEGTQFATAAMFDFHHVAPAQPEPLHLRIAETNHRRVGQLGVAAVAALFDDIRRDRDQAYATLRDRPPRDT